MEIRVRHGALLGALLAGVTLGSVAAADDEPVTTVYVVRHAEKAQSAANPRDPMLSERGAAQAADLRDLLAGTDVVAVYSTPYLRTLGTAAPTAGTAGLTTIRYRPGALGKPDGLPSRTELLSNYRGSSVLVVGHSNTTPRIVAHLGGPEGIEIAEDEYDNLFVVELRGEETRVRRHRYGPLLVTRRIEVEGESDADVSAVTVVGKRLLVCSDEGTALREWNPAESGYVAGATLALEVDRKGVTELDLEGLATDGQFVYAVGSHSLVRRTARERERSGKPETYSDNQRRLSTVRHGGKDERDRVFRIPIDDVGQARADLALSLDLRELLADDPFLGRSTEIPSKENGLDIEGLAVGEGELLLGLRGPVLRGNLTPVVRLRTDEDFERVKSHEVHFLDLAGDGVRDLVRCSSGYLVLAGPVGDAPHASRVYHWDGEDMLPGVRDEDDTSHRRGRLTLLGTIPTIAGAAPEGLTVLRETDAEFVLLTVYDGAPGGAPTELRVRRLPGL